jgi:hypothetical protein
MQLWYYGFLNLGGPCTIFPVVTMGEWYLYNDDSRTPFCIPNVIGISTSLAATSPHASMVSSTLAPSPPHPLPSFIPKTPNHAPPLPQLLILRHPTRRRRSMSPVSTCSIHHNRAALCSAAYLLLHIRPVLDILPEIAYVAPDFLVRLERKGDKRDEAECEPFPALHYTVGVLANVW